MELIITQRRSDATVAKIIYKMIPTKPKEWSANDGEESLLLMEAEMNGNSSGKVRVNFST